MLSTCTPIKPVGDEPQQTPTTDASDGAVSQIATVMNAVNTTNSACTQPDALSCEPGNPSRQPLRCANGTWNREAHCAEDEFCDSTDEPTRGTCVKIAAECIGRLPGKAFCDKDDLRVCANGVSQIMQHCGEPQRCAERNDGSRACQCPGGTAPVNGSCDVATSCDVDRGNCDLLTECSMRGPTPVCSACPPGYLGGDGSRGCTPLLLDLKAMSGEVTPALSDRNFVYGTRLPLSRPKLTLSATAAPGVKIDINGIALGETGSWTSDVMAVGDHAVALTLTAENGLSTRYELNVTRNGIQEASLQPIVADVYDTFGYSVAVSGDTIVVGATGEDGAQGGVDADASSNGALDSGAAYVFVREENKWVQQAYLKAAQPATGDYFGFSVAIEGDTILVGASRGGDHRTDAQRLGVPQRPGQVHVFEREGKVWSETHVLQSGRSEVDWFGYSFAFTKDSIFIGAAHDAESGEDAGAVYVLARDGSWSSMTKLLPPEPVVGGGFGWSVATDGDALLVGAPQTTLTQQGPGMAFPFKRSAGIWIPEPKLTAPTPTAGAGFGWSVALQGELAAIGAPHPGYPHAQQAGPFPHGDAFVFQRLMNGWTQTHQLQAVVPRDSDFFGITVALSDRTLVVSASGDTSSETGVDADPRRGNVESAGAFHIFAERATDWMASSFVKSSNVKAGAFVADRIALWGDTLVIGAMHDAGATSSDSGRVYVFR